MEPEIIALGSAIKLAFFVVSFVPIAILARKYDSRSGKSKKTFPFFLAYFILALTHYLIWDYYVLTGKFQSYLWSSMPGALLLAIFLLLSGVSFLHFGFSRLYSFLFSQEVFDKRVITGIFGAMMGAHVFLHYFKTNPMSALVLSIYSAVWVSLSMSYVLKAEMCRKLGVRFSSFAYFGAAASLANLLIFLAAMQIDEQAFSEAFYILRLSAFLVLLIGGALAAIPALSFLKMLTKSPERISEKSLPPIYSFVQSYVWEYARIIGSVSYLVRDSALAEFKRQSGLGDFSLESKKNLSDSDEVLLASCVVSEYSKLTGSLAKTIAKEVLSQNQVLSREYSKKLAHVLIV